MTSDTASAMKRLGQDLVKMDTDPYPGISASPTDENFLIWDAIIFGPNETPFEGGAFKVQLQFPSNYPEEPPKARFTSAMFHPNVYPCGSICLDILQNREKWSSDYDAGVALMSIQILLGEPNPNSPANNEAKNLFLNDTKEYEKKVKECVALSNKT